MRKTLFVAVLLCFAFSCFAQNKGKQPQAIIETSMGRIHCTLFPDKAPKSVANFIGLADGTKDWTDPTTHQKKHGVPLYDGTIFHRVIPGFMIQGGDPAGNGTGNPGYGFGLEVTPDLKFDRPGRTGLCANFGSQYEWVAIFYHCGRSCFFGRAIHHFRPVRDFDVVEKIINGARDRNDRPYEPARIMHIKIVK